jgi:hypothetical protein
MKRLSNLLIATIAVLALAIFASAFSFNTIPDQTHVQNTTNDKTIILSNYASNDTTNYFSSCNATELTTNLVGSGHEQNLTFQPVQNYVGTSVCNVTATNGTANLSQTFNVVVSAHNAALTTTNPAALTWVKTVSSTEKATFTLSNTGNTDLSVSLSIIDFVDTSNASNTIANTIASFNESTLVLAPGASKNIKLSLTGISANQESDTYASNITIAYNSSSTQSTKLLPVTLTVRNAVSSINTVSSLRLGESGISLGANVSSIFTLTNNGDLTVSNLDIRSNANAKYEVKFTLSNSTNSTSNITIASLQPKEAVNVTVSGKIPKDGTAGARTDIGDILLTSATANFSIDDFFIDPVSKLRIIEVEVDYKDLQNNDKGVKLEESDEGDTINNVQPGTEVRIRVKLQNDFTDSEDAQIKDIDLTVTIQDVNDGSDLDDEESDIEVNEDSSQKIDFSFIIPADAEKDTFTVLVEADGRDDKFGARHKDEFRFQIEVDRKPFEVEITKVELQNPVLTCTRNTMLEMEVRNIGSKELDEVKVEIINADLGINFVKENIALTIDYTDIDSREKITFPIVLKNNAENKNYVIRTKAYFSRSTLDDVKDVQLTVRPCDPSEENKKEETKTTEEDAPSHSGDTDKKESNTPSQKQDAIFLDEEISEFKQSNAYFTLLLVGFLVLLGIVAAMIAVLVMPKD